MRPISQLSILALALAAPCTVAFLAPSASGPAFATRTAIKGAESEVDFGDLDGEKVRIGIIKTRWNKEHVTNLSDGIKKALKDCGVHDDNVFETEVPGAFEIPLAAKFLSMSGTVDAIVTCGVLIKGETLHFEYISEAVSSGLMSVGLQTSMPMVYGVLNCVDEEQVIKRSSGDNNHGYDWGKTAVEMALLRNEALGKTVKMGNMGFNTGDVLDKTSELKKESLGFF
jgi:6,7-dimethyl-8-ribityllumazine synthase